MLRSFPSFPLNPCFLYLLGGPYHPCPFFWDPIPPFPHLCPPCEGGPLIAVTILPAGKAETPLGGSQGCSLFHTCRTKERWAVQKIRQQLLSVRSNAESWTSQCWALMNSTRSASWLSGTLGGLSLALLEINLFFFPLRTGNSVDASQTHSKP